MTPPAGEARPRAVLVTGADPRASLGIAAAVAIEAASAEAPGGAGRPSLLAEAGPAARRRPTTLLASPAARELEGGLREAGHAASARGHICHLGVEQDPGSLSELGELAAAAGAGALVVRVRPEAWEDALECPELAARGGLLLARLPEERSLAALAVDDLLRRGLTARVVTRPLAPLGARRAIAGIRPGGAAQSRLRRAAAALLRGGERGQALPAVLAAAAAIVGCALILAAIGGAVTGEARAQRAADLAALSAARQMRDEAPRLLAPERLPDGSPNPRHLPKPGYLARARAAAIEAGRRNGVAAERIEVSFPDRGASPPLRAKVTVRGEMDPSSLPGGERIEAERGEADPIEVVASAVAEASAPGGDWTGMPSRASGGGYSGPLVHRNGEGMRPDVGAAFDRMAAAARGAGHPLVVTSGFRSDAEQAALFAAHPDPRWVAPPGRSLHRCATELDLGPSSAYGWLAANAARFGFVQRYSWEAWHYGFTAGPPPCSAAGESGGLGGSAARGAGGGPDGGASSRSLPAFVPARFRAPLLRSAARWDVSAALLAAQLEAESGFDPGAVSPAGAQGIAQFMPGTAASYGLRNPFDPVAAIDAQAHLMSDLLRRFRSVPLALAGYNAGPGAVEGCMCVPDYPETRAYVARITALLTGAGVPLDGAPALEVRLVR